MAMPASPSVPVDAHKASRPAALAEPPGRVFPFLRLPRELRDLIGNILSSLHCPLALLANRIQIYDCTFRLEDDRGIRALRIERRHLKYFRPTPAAILLVLHHEYFLVNRQLAREALEILLKNHTILLSAGPFVLKALLQRIEAAPNGPGRQWLKWMRSIQLDWVTFPNLVHYPPDRSAGREEWYWETEDDDDDEGGHYDDNLYDASDATLYPSFQWPPTGPTADDANDDDDAPPHLAREDISTKLDLVVAMEVAPLFTYLSTPTFALDSITTPLYFISRESHVLRNTTRPGYVLPLQIRYWVHVCAHALLMLVSGPSALNQVVVRYMPWDIWACMTPADDLPRLVTDGVWFDGPPGHAAHREGEGEGEGEAFRAVWGVLRSKGCTGRMGLETRIRHVKWDGNMNASHMGDELEVVFRRQA
ncbi:hypothetical protein ACEQ8H_000846 [Pleosporales sp. CAS-2024a]